LVAPNALNRSGRGGRDRRSKFYELSDNLLERLGLLTAETAHGRVTFRADDVVHLLEQ
jgi:hypothetical protein